MNDIDIEIQCQTAAVPLDEQQCGQALRCICRDAKVQQAHFSIAVVDDRQSRELHLRYLGQDTPTDVLSFALNDDATAVDGEIVVNADMALRQATGHGWQPSDELLLYIVHGGLHLVGYDDHNESDRERMFAQQRKLLEELGYDAALLAIAVNPTAF